VKNRLPFLGKNDEDEPMTWKKAQDLENQLGEKGTE
jgi:hypothetical protein